MLCCPLLVEMFDLPVPNTTDVLPLSCNDQVIKLLWQKLASTEAEATKLGILSAVDDSLMTDADVHSFSNSNFPSGTTVMASANDRKSSTLSPILASVPETNARHTALVSRICRMESAIGSFRVTVARISRERDYWKQEKLSSGEHYTREADALRTEISRLYNESESKCRNATEAKEKLDKTNEQLRNDLVQAVNSMVSISQIRYYFQVFIRYDIKWGWRMIQKFL